MHDRPATALPTSYNNPEKDRLLIFYKERFLVTICQNTFLWQTICKTDET